MAEWFIRRRMLGIKWQVRIWIGRWSSIFHRRHARCRPCSSVPQHLRVRLVHLIYIIFSLLTFISLYSTVSLNFQNELKITRTKWKFRHLKLKWIQIPLKLEFEFFLSCDKLLVDKFVWNLFSPYLATRAIPLMAFAYQIFTSDGQIFTRLQCSAAATKIPFSAPKNDDVPPFSLVIRIRKKIISIHFNV